MTATAVRRKVKTPSFRIDDRTSEMSDVALRCRKRGHKWEEKSLSRKRFNELAELGQQEENLYCERMCGSTWYQLWDIENETLLEEKREYPKGLEYLMPKGTGRLRRGAARKALFARQTGVA